MPSNTIPLAMPDELLSEVRRAAKETGLSQADVMRQSMKAGLAKVREQYKPAAAQKPFTKEEARRAFAPDPEWEALESAMARRPKPKPEPD